MKIIQPVWPAPQHIVAGTTTRYAGDNLSSDKNFNLATHVNDEEKTVLNNRQQLAKFCRTLNINPDKKKAQWQWLQQIHSTQAIELTEHSTDTSSNKTQADAAWTQCEQQICVVLTADCLPILLCDKQGLSVAAIHAGWRGLANGIVANCINQMCTPCNTDSRTGHTIKANDLYAWLGPAIGPQKFEVGEEVKTVFSKNFGINKAYSQAIEQAFVVPANHLPNKYLADIYQLATIALHQTGVRHIYGGGFCTVSDSERFFSYRRENITGRMANFIYIDK